MSSQESVEPLPITPWITPAEDLSPFPSTLPIPLTPLVGRTRELHTCIATLEHRGTRLLTLTGTGGVGKTRLALAVAEQVQTHFRHGVIFVPLADVKDPDLVFPTIARSLGMQDDGEGPVIERLTTTLQTRQVLLVLDNLEQVVSVARDIADLLQRCPNLLVMGTSRIALRVRGEQEIPIQPLALPDPAGSALVPELAEIESVSMFLQTARGHAPDFALTEQNAATIAEICRRLDGLPLGIELAASRLRMLSPSTLLRLLERRLRLLSFGPRDLPERQRTLRDAIRWSYDLLPPEDQLRFRQLSIFIGGFGIASAARITQTSESESLNALTHLTEHHLIRPVSAPLGEARFRMLETLREFGVELLEESGELLATRNLHADWCVELAATAATELTGTDQVAWLETLETEHDNLRAALAWSIAESPSNAARMAAALWRFWWIRGYVREGRAWLQRVIELSDEVSPAERAAALYAAAELSEALSDSPDAIALHTQALVIFEELRDDVGRAECLNGLGIVERALGNLDEAEHLHNQALPLLQSAQNRRGEASTLNNLAAIAYYRGNFAQAEAHWERALEIVREIGDLRATGLLLGNQGAVALLTGQHHRSIALQKESLVVARQLADPDSISRSLINLGGAYVEVGDLDRAREALEEGLLHSRQVEDARVEANAHYTLGKIALLTRDHPSAARSYLKSLVLLAKAGDLPGVATSLEGLGRVASEVCLHEDAIRLFGTAHHIRETTGAARESTEDAGYDQALLASRAAVDRGAADSLWKEGLNRSIDEAVLVATSMTDQVQQMPATRSEPLEDRAGSRLISPYGLTPREIEILGFLGAHHTDREIAEALYISPRTVGTHITSIRNKLGVTSRREAARIAAESGLA
jgi:predicted ATPase/DNA-binding CsgD family transcriptional regulator/Tfp pilus assembly protein PilF